MTLDPNRISLIRRRLKKSTGTDLQARHHYDAMGRYISSEVYPVAVHASNGDGGMTNYVQDKTYDDAEFFAHAPTDLQYLLDLLTPALELLQRTKSPDDAEDTAEICTCKICEALLGPAT
ncbi:hypothetical protein M3B43_11885 [Nesterenkonia massiliensis]|uniref:Uncharacterized protein n=1 Tax=Nesterenkonia massiliensis TaxID=1232429 RepID=A0ABT2HTJ3_9MICC|nr:hypothetical protein [Nesterenkonia massiliensis]MCT1608001.1 hypothetical protein [Nesterenkonia massiliensis]